MGAGYCYHSPPIRLLAVKRLKSWGTFRQYISTSCFPELTIYRLSSRRLLAMTGEGSLFEGLPYLLTLYPSLISSTFRTSRPILSRLSVGGGRTRLGSRVAPVGLTGPYTSIGHPASVYPQQGRPGTCLFRRLPLVAVPDVLRM